ncbi:MAG TPA: hypothetical protein DCL63_04510 [Firmicutes bacterium]|jgi:hypothetical protein|nr:hypothetical protein [Bacillota bacterium]
MKKATIVSLALALVLAASSFASAANYIGGGIGIVGPAPAVESGAASADSDSFPIIFTLALDYDLMDKLSVSANGYIQPKKKPVSDAAGTGLGDYDIFGLAGGYVKYALANLDALKLGAVAGAKYNKGFVPSGVDRFSYGAGVFAEQPLGETGTIYGQAMYWMWAKEEGIEKVETAERIGVIGGINFKVTEKIAVKGQVEYANKQALFSIGAGYTF